MIRLLTRLGAAAGSSSGGSSALLAPGPGVVTLGDSFMANGITAGATSQSYVNAGCMTWARIFLGDRISYPPENQLGVGGTTWAAIVATVDAAIAKNPGFAVVDGGTNDSNSLTSANFATNLAIAKNGAMTAARKFLAAGVLPIFLPITPRVLNFTTLMGQFHETYNRWLMEFCAGRPDLLAAAGIPATQRPFCVNIEKAYDYASTSGGSNVGLFESPGKLHPTNGFGMLWGAQLADIMAGFLPPSPLHLTSPYDLYDATYHPAGNLLVTGGANQGLLRGTSGALGTGTGVTISGQVAGTTTGAYKVERTAGTSTVSITCSKENPRADGLVTGERQRVQVACSTTGSALESYRMIFANGISNITTGFAEGDLVVFQCRYQINVAVNFAGLSASLQASGGATNFTANDGQPASNQVPGVSSALYPDLLRPGYLRTAPFAVPAGTVRLAPAVVASLNASDVAPSIDFFTSDWRVFKVV